jgi:hypothetical protein
VLPACLGDRDIRDADVHRNPLDGLLPSEGVELTPTQHAFFGLHHRPPLAGSHAQDSAVETVVEGKCPTELMAAA